MNNVEILKDQYNRIAVLRNHIDNARKHLRVMKQNSYSAEDIQAQSGYINGLEQAEMYWQNSLKFLEYNLGLEGKLLD